MIQIGNPSSTESLKRLSYTWWQIGRLPLAAGLTIAVLLQQSAVMVAFAQKKLEFDAVSIRPNVKEPGGGYYFTDSSPNGPQWGFGCHGSDGIPRAPFGTGPGILLPLGRCVGNGVQLAHLMSYAYGTPWRYGSGVPDWARPYASVYGGDAFHIEATAENPATTTTAQLRQMLQTMLADRFNLRTHTEPQQVPGYALRIVKSGLKIKPVSGEVEQPKDVLIGGRSGIKGKSSLKELVRFLNLVVNGSISIDIPLVDATGLEEIYEYEFLRSSTGGGARGASASVGGSPPPTTRSERIDRMVNDLSDMMEDRLGLELKPEKVPVEIVVIDQVEQPSPN
jgi:uncharacterized protein (TIGR03435 family)